MKFLITIFFLLFLATPAFCDTTQRVDENGTIITTTITPNGDGTNSILEKREYTDKTVTYTKSFAAPDGANAGGDFLWLVNRAPITIKVNGGITTENTYTSEPALIGNQILGEVVMPSGEVFTASKTYSGTQVTTSIIPKPQTASPVKIYRDSLDLPLQYEYKENITITGVYLVPTGKVFYKMRDGSLREIEKIYGSAPGPFEIVFKK